MLCHNPLVNGLPVLLILSLRCFAELFNPIMFRKEFTNIFNYKQEIILFKKGKLKKIVNVALVYGLSHSILGKVLKDKG